MCISALNKFNLDSRVHIHTSPHAFVIPVNPSRNRTATRNYPRLHERKLHVHNYKKRYCHPVVCQQSPNDAPLDQNPPNSSQPFASYRRSVATLKSQIAAVRERYRRVAKEVRTLERLSEECIVGSDFSNLYIGKTSLIQDLRVPTAPKFWDLQPEVVQQMVYDYLVDMGLSYQACDQHAKHLQLVMRSLRGWTLELSDQVRPVLLSSNEQLYEAERIAAIDSLISIIALAGYSILPVLPAPLNPPVPDALSMGSARNEALDPTLFEQTSVLDDIGSYKANPSYFPYVFIATRGVSVVKSSGLLLPQKLRAMERTYFGWIRTPFTVLFDKLLSLSGYFWRRGSKHLSRKNNSNPLTNPSQPNENPPRSGAGAMSQDQQSQTDESVRLVRRIVPAGKLEGIWEALNKLFLPTLTQEPTHSSVLFLYREIVPDKKRMMREKRAALEKQIKASILQAINPIPTNDQIVDTPLDGVKTNNNTQLKQPVGTLKPVSLQIFNNVPWGKLHHFFPAVFVIPATKDLFRIDALTFAGLISAIFTYIRNAESPFILILLLSSVSSYVLRVAYGWSQAAVAYKGRIANEKASALVAQQASSLDYLANLAAQELFVEASCIFASRILGNKEAPSTIQKAVFGGVTLDRERENFLLELLNDGNL